MIRQKRTKCGSTLLPSTSTLRALTDGSGRYSFDTTAASTTPPRSALKRSRSPPTGASLISESGMLARMSAARATISGGVPGDDAATDLPLRSSIRVMPARASMT